MRVVSPARSRFTVPDPQTNQPMLFVTAAGPIGRAVGDRGAGGPQAEPPARRDQPLAHPRRGRRARGSFFTFFTASGHLRHVHDDPHRRAVARSTSTTCRRRSGRGSTSRAASSGWSRRRRSPDTGNGSGAGSPKCSCRAARARCGRSGWARALPAHVAPTFPEAARRASAVPRPAVPRTGRLRVPDRARHRRSARDVLASLRPAVTVSQAVRTAMQVGSPASTTGDELEPVMDAPTFPAADVRRAARPLASDHLFPGLERRAPRHRAAAADERPVHRVVHGRPQQRDGPRAAVARLSHRSARHVVPAVLGRDIRRRGDRDRHSADSRVAQAARSVRTRAAPARTISCC